MDCSIGDAREHQHTNKHSSYLEKRNLFAFHFSLFTSKMFRLKLRPLFVDDVLHVYILVVKDFLGIHLLEELFQIVI